MRIRNTNQGLTLRATAGSHVVLLGMDMSRDDCPGHLGFAIHRTDPQANEAWWLEGIKTFEATDPGFPPGALYPTNKHPIQGFSWSDLTAKPGRRYIYKVQALSGTPQALQPFKEVEVEVTTEPEGNAQHSVFFNRGAAASQEYARRFGNKPPNEKDPADPRWAWLSRGAMEAIEAFAARALDASWSLRVSAYEFSLDLVGKALRAAHLRHADVKVLYDGNANPPDKNGAVFPRDANRAMAKAAGIKSLCQERITRSDVVSPPIAHNKFIVLAKDGKAQAVLTGSTNFSRGGVFGQSNVVHVVDDPAVAAQYLELWKLFAAKPAFDALRTELSHRNVIPTELPPAGTRTLFSPQQTLRALQWYAQRAKAAPRALFMTFAFGINKLFLDAYQNGASELRYALLDKLLGPGIKAADRAAAEEAMHKLRAMPQNRFAVGSHLALNQFDRWVKETLTGLNLHVQYIHTKFMLVDPLGSDPIIVSGSANFSDASTLDNDENMLVIRGDTRVADIYVGEYMRLWSHYAFREWAARQTSVDPTFKFLDTQDKWWRSYFGNSDRSRQRAYFSSPI